MYPRSSYIIYATPRSGSYLLCEALTNTGLAGRPVEHFEPSAIVVNSSFWGVSPLDSAAYLQGVYTAGTTPNGVFGTKIIWQALENTIDLLRDIEGNEKRTLPELLANAFPHHRAIIIIRRDKVRQAISFWKAIQTDEWLSLDNETSVRRQHPLGITTQEPTFNFYGIEALRQRIVDEEREMQAYFSSLHIEPFTVVYEDFVHAYEETALRILDYLRIPVPDTLVFGERKMKKQSNDQTEEWVQQYYQTKKAEEKQALALQTF